MTILYLHQYFTFPDSAGGTRSYDLSVQFVNAGYKVIIITSSANIQLKSRITRKWTILKKDGLEIHIVNLPYKNNFSYWKKVLIFAKFLYTASLRSIKVKADIVIASSPPLPVVVPAIIKKWVHKTPFIFEVRDIWPDTQIAVGLIRSKFLIRAYKLFTIFAYAQSDHIVTLSRDMKKSILKNSIIKENCISIIPNISDLSRFEHFDKRKSYIFQYIKFKPQKVVLYAGTLGIVNGLRYMIDLAASTIFLDSSIIFLIFGDGKEKEELITYAKTLGIFEQNIFFQNPIPKIMLPQIYSECTVATSFVLPNEILWANSANKFFDCLAAGRPIVINHLGWMAEEIEANNLGYILKNDISSIHGQAIDFCKYINNSQLLKEQCHNARRAAMDYYSLDIASIKYNKILKNILCKYDRVLA